MSQNSDKLRSAVEPPAAADPAIDGEARPGASHLVDEEGDPYYYGWRDRWETLPDGHEELRREPLTYDHLLSPEVGDFIAEDTIHHQVTADIEAILKRRYAGEATVAADLRQGRL